MQNISRHICYKKTIKLSHVNSVKLFILFKLIAIFVKQDSINMETLLRKTKPKSHYTK